MSFRCRFVIAQAICRQPIASLPPLQEVLQIPA
jgi:hypothetical protein